MKKEHDWICYSCAAEIVRAGARPLHEIWGANETPFATGCLCDRCGGKPDSVVLYPNWRSYDSKPTVMKQSTEKKPKSASNHKPKQAVRSAERAVDAVYFYWRPNSQPARTPAEAKQILRREATACAKIGRKLDRQPAMPVALARVWHARAQALRWALRVMGRE